MATFVDAGGDGPAVAQPVAAEPVSDSPIKEDMARALIGELFQRLPQVQHDFCATPVLRRMPAWEWLLDKHGYRSVVQAGRAAKGDLPEKDREVMEETERLRRMVTKETPPPPPPPPPPPVAKDPAVLRRMLEEQGEVIVNGRVIRRWQDNCGRYTYTIDEGDHHYQQADEALVAATLDAPSLDASTSAFNLDQIRSDLAKLGLVKVAGRTVLAVPKADGVTYRIRGSGHDSFREVAEAVAWIVGHDPELPLANLRNRDLVWLARETNASWVRERVVKDLYDRQARGMVSTDLSAALTGLKQRNHGIATREAFVAEWDRLVTTLRLTHRDVFGAV